MKPISPRAWIALVALVLPACASEPAPRAATPESLREARAPRLYDDLGSWTRPVTTRSRLAQKCFDQALTLTYAFNHDEAIRLYGEAARADPTCAMAYWGISLANGPHINNPAMPPERSKAAWEALEKARAAAKAGGATDAERALIEALAARYPPEHPADRRPYDEAYAAAMREVWKAHPDDPDVGTLFAEALLDLHPWDLWTKDFQPTSPDTLEAVGALEQVLALAPDHPGALHLYIHAMEASAEPERAAAAADRLRRLVPGASHLVHMPGHIDLRLGKYAAASEANLLALEADRKHGGLFPRAGFYRLYMAHNHHFLAFSSMMEGRYAPALRAAQEMVDGVPLEFIESETGLIDGYLPVVLHVLVRFGRWDEILAQPPFDDRLIVANAIRHYARGVALAALGRLDEAEAEERAFAGWQAKMDDRPVGNSSGKDVLRVAENLLAGEIECRRGRTEEGLARLREAARVEDTLRYDEPPDWMHPARHALGAWLVSTGRNEEAARVLREDLARFPDNGWSLTSLAAALEGLGDAEGAAEARARAAQAFAKADVEITSACFCRPGP